LICFEDPASRLKGASMNVSMTVNGREVSGDVEPRLLLVDYLRNDLGLTGTNIGCDTSQCGACTVHLDGVAAKSCTVLAVQADGMSITTIEGLASNGELHPMQQAFWDSHGLQCGFCTPGMVMASVKLAEGNPGISDDEVRHGLEGNLCRCTGYENIVKAVKAGAASMAGGGS
jgi:carbon-monoxide dehydrogenase small subunit